MISIYPVAAFPAATVTAGAVLRVLPPDKSVLCAPAEAALPEACCAPADAEAAAPALPEPADADEVPFPEDTDELRTTVLVVPPPTRSRPAAKTLVAHPSMLNVSATVINIFVTFFLAPLIAILPLFSIRPVGNPLYSLTDTDYITVLTAKKALFKGLFYFFLTHSTDSVIHTHVPQDLVCKCVKFINISVI